MEKKKGNLPTHMLGQWRDPEVQRKAKETRMRNLEEKKRRKEAAQTGFGISVLADPSKQAELINRLYTWALGDDEKLALTAMKMLSDMGVTKQPSEKPEDDGPAKKENMSIEDSISILKRAQKDASESGKTVGEFEDEQNADGKG